MKKFLLFILSLAIFLSASVVPVERAQKVAENYYQNYAPVTEKGNAVQKILTKEYMGQPTWYVVQFTKGWVIVSADDAVRPILGYSFDGKITEDLENMQNPFVNRFSYYDRQIVHTVREKGYVDGKSSAEWKEIENGVFPKDSKAIIVPALIETKWGQGWPWNEMCPAGTPVGCVATAMHQIMRYWQNPAQGAGSHSYDDIWGSTTGSHSVNFSSAVYDWDLMAPLTSGQVTTQAQIDELAELSYHCGVAVEMDYEASGSGAYISDVTSALETYFDFSTDAAYISVGTVTNATSQSTKIRTDLDIGHPIIWGGSGSQGGHAFILDGYTDDYYYHFNWGWEGNFDGWFQLNDLTPDSMDFTSSQSCVYNLWGYGPYPYPAPNIESIEISDRENIIISWSIPSYHNEILYFEIFRNNEAIVQLPDSVFSYTDYALPAGTYNYTVDAAYQYFPSTAYCPSVEIEDDLNYPTPRYFETYLETYNRHHIDLSWSAPSAATPDSYRIFRNDTLADEVLFTGEEETYRDSLFSDGWNEYYIKAVYPTGVSIPSVKSNEFMDANPKPWFLNAFLPGASTVELSWFEPYTTPSQWFNYVDKEPDSWWDHMPSGLGFDYSAYQNRTLFNKDEIYEYPVIIDSIAAAFYEDTEDPWVSDKFTFSIYSGGSTVMGPTAEITAVSGKYVKYPLPDLLDLTAPWYVIVDPKDNTKGHPGILSSYTDQTHSETYLDLSNDGTPDGWHNISADSLYHEWWISCHVTSGLPSNEKNSRWISFSPVISVNGRKTPEIELKDLKIIPAGFLGYKIYRDNAEIATTDSTSYTDILSKELTTADYHVTAFYEDPTGESAPSNVVTVTITSIEDNVPYETALSQNYPNPFNPETNIKFTIASDTKVSLKIFNTSGQLVAVPVDRFMKRGSYNINMNASKLSGGVYIYKLEADGKEFSKKMTVVK